MIEWRMLDLSLQSYTCTLVEQVVQLFGTMLAKMPASGKTPIVAR